MTDDENPGFRPEEKKPQVEKVRGKVESGMHRTAIYIGFLFGCIAAIWFVLEIADSMKVLQ